MDEALREAIIRDPVVDITTTGRKSGKTRRIEIWCHELEGRLYITGTPGRRDWYANMVAHPDFILHLKGSMQRDLPARATPVTDVHERCKVFQGLLLAEERMRNVEPESWARRSPLVKVELQG